jgi:hypothetical protein
MSRIALVTLMFISAPAMAAPNVGRVVATYETMTRVEPRCASPTGDREIVVCGRRHADRWRVPYLLKDAGDPSIQNVSAERNGLIPTTTPCKDHSIFLIGCGKGVGISATVGIGVGAGGVKLRPLAD